ncbi:hypothetical protein F8S13_07870 [Chloroflexia bacterium SDU3-3]|nr:hypothetical protein F8S13_07870 [Chloroflexia bacterium SDU3-3]
MHEFPLPSPNESASDDQSALDDVLLQIERAITALVSVADQVVAAAVPRQAIPLLFERIDFNARRAGEAMRVLRELNLSNNTPATELSQSLTVVVLVADMVVSGHLPPTSLGDEDLFRRNVLRAQHCLAQLQEGQS